MDEKTKKPSSKPNEGKPAEKVANKPKDNKEATKPAKEDKGPKDEPNGNLLDSFEKADRQPKRHFDRDDTRSGRGGRGGRGRGRGRGEGRGEGGEFRREKREFDRHSGTGRGREVSRGGRGPGGWGNPEEEAHIAEKHVEVVEPVLDEENAGPAAEAVDESGESAEQAANAEPVVEAPPEPKVFTLDEYLASKAGARANTELFGQVQERQVDADFSGMRSKQDNLSNFIDLGNAKSAKAKKEQQRSSAKTTIVDLGFRNALLDPENRPRDENRRDDRGGRGGRGRGRGEGRGEGKPSVAPSRHSAGAAVNILDANAFPAL